MGSTYSFDNFEIDAVKRTLFRAGQPVRLKPKAFDLLLVLVTRHGEILTKTELMDLVWENQYVEEKNLTVHVAALRKALGETKQENRFITTVPGRGYGFVATLNDPALAELDSIESVEPIAAAKAVEDSEILPVTPSPPHPARSRTRWVGRLLLFALPVLLVGSMVTGYFLLMRNRAVGSPAAPVPDFTLKRLTTSGKVSLASLSQDGRFFAFILQSGDQRSLWLGNVEGGDPIQLIPPRDATYISLSFAPDGDQIYYVMLDKQHLSGCLYRSPVLGGAQEMVLDDVETPVAISPDGKKAAYTRDDEDDDSASLIVTDLATGTDTSLVDHPYAQRFATFSPAWSPDGTMISFAAFGDDERSLQLFTVSAAGGKVTPVSSQTWNYVRMCVWLRDGSGLMIVGEETGLQDGRWQLYRVSYPAGEVHLFNQNLDSYGSSLCLSADGKSLLAIEQHLLSNIWVSPAGELTKSTQITFGTPGQLDGWFGLDWTPDGRIVYTANVDTSKTIWIMGSDGSNQRQLVPSGGENLAPSVTPDGRYVVFQSNRSGPSEVWRIGLDGSDLRQLTNEPSAEEPHVSADSSWIIYTTKRGNAGELWRISIDGGDPQRFAGMNAHQPRISRDGKSLACGIQSGNQEKLAIFSTAGGEPEKVFDLAPNANLVLGIHWTPDGKAVTYRDWFNGIWMQRIVGEEPDPMKGLPHEKLYAYEWSKDGKSFAFTRGSEIRDVILISNFK